MTTGVAFLQSVNGTVHGPLHHIRAARSPVQPLVLAAVLRTCSAASLPYHTLCLPLTRALCAVWAATLPLWAVALLRRMVPEPAPAVMAGAWLSLGHYWVTLGGSTLVQPFVAPAVLAALLAAHPSTKTALPQVAGGLVAGVALYVRPDVAVSVATHLLCFGCALPKARWLAGCALGAAVGGCCDYVYYGVAGVSAWHWFLFNAVERLSALSGTQPLLFYLRNPPLGGGALLPCCLAAAALAAWARLCGGGGATPPALGVAARCAAVAGIHVAAFSAQPHKESRFLYLVSVAKRCGAWSTL